MKLTLNKKDFINALKIAIITAAKKDVRHCLNGVLIEACAGNVVNIVGANYHAITRVTLNAPVVDTHSYIITRDDVERLIKSTTVAPNGKPNEITDTIELEYSKGESQGQIHTHDTVNVRDNGNAVICKLIDGVFPDYRRLIPTGDGESVEKVNVNHEYISDAMKALKIVTHKSQGVVFNFNGANGLIVMRPASFHTAGQMVDVMIGVMPMRV